MNREFQVTLKGNTITLPDDLLKASHLRDGDVLDLVAHSPDRFTLIRQAAHRDLFKAGAHVDGAQVQAYLTKQGFVARSDNPDVWEKHVTRNTAEGKALGKVYTLSVSLSDLLSHPDHFAAFVRRHH